VSISLKSKFIGSILGTAIGDALGMPVEGWSPSKIEEVFGEVREMMTGFLPEGSYTDDTEMAIGIAETIIEKGRVDPDHLIKVFMHNYDPRRGYGISTTMVFRLIEKGIPWDEASKSIFNGKGSYGNGAAMRIAPVAVFYYDDFEELKRAVYDASRVTHMHPLGIEGALIQATAIALAVRKDPRKRLDVEDFVDNLLLVCESDVFREKVKKIGRMLAEGINDKYVVVKELGNGYESFTSVPSAIYSFLLHWSSFEDAVVYAVSLGGDADTIGAMTGAISGAYHGVEAIPQRWLEKLENYEYLKSLGEKLWELKTKSK